MPVRLRLVEGERGRSPPCRPARTRGRARPAAPGRRRCRRPGRCRRGPSAIAFSTFVGSQRLTLMPKPSTSALPLAGARPRGASRRPRYPRVAPDVELLQVDALDAERCAALGAVLMVSGLSTLVSLVEKTASWSSSAACSRGSRPSTVDGAMAFVTGLIFGLEQHVRGRCRRRCRRSWPGRARLISLRAVAVSVGSSVVDESRSRTSSATRPVAVEDRRRSPRSARSRSRRSP